MEIKKVHIGGNREEINRETGEHTPNFIDNVKRSDLIFTPEKLIEKLFRGSSQEYERWLIKNRLHPTRINYHDINQKHELIKRLRVYTMRLLEEAKTDSMFSNQIGNIMVSKWLDSFDTLENHIYDLSDFNKIEFLKISDAFQKRFTTNAPFAFLSIDEENQQLKVVSSHKVLLLAERELPMGNKRGTPVGQIPEKFYQTLFTSIGYKGKGELTEGLNYHRTNFKNFNFNVNIETRLLNDIIYDSLGYDKKETQVAFLFGVYGKKLYFESDIEGTERTKEELEALAIAEDATAIIGRELHKERQGTIAVDKTTLEVEKRIAHPKVFEEKREPRVEPKTIIATKPISDTLEAFEKEMFIRQQGYVELAKEKINEALTNREQYIEEFYAFLKKGMGVSDALSKFSERYANNPYIKGIIETSITGELQLQALKDKGIEELSHNIDVLQSEKEELQKELDGRETQIASLHQNIESLVVSHTKQLEEIEVNVSKLVEERVELVETNTQQFEMIEELEKLIIQYEETLKSKDREIKDKEIEQTKAINLALIQPHREIESLGNDNRNLIRKIENSDSEMKYYRRQIEQLKEENSLILSATDLLKTSNKELEKQLETLKKD